MKYEVLIFDADDTLYDYSKAEIYALKNLFKDIGIDYNEIYQEIYNEINKKIWEDFEKGLISQKDLKNERFKILFDKLNFKSLDFKNINFGEIYQEHLSNADFLFEESLDIIKKLHKKYRLAIITNGLLKVQEKRIRKNEIAKYFEEIVISDEVNMRKPNKDIFDYTLNKMQVEDRTKVLMIGDSLTSDILGGINSGIDTCFINLYKKKNKSDINANFEINHVRELKNYL